MSQGAPPLVLVVDDDASIRRSLTRLFQAVGLEVETFGSAGELLAYDRPDRPLCLVLDVYLRDMTGIDLLRILAERGLSLPVVVITAESEAHLPATAFAAEIAVLRKPFEEERLLGEVWRLLDLSPP